MAAMQAAISPAAAQVAAGVAAHRDLVWLGFSWDGVWPNSQRSAAWNLQVRQRLGEV
jgi:hypothetical protein